MYSESGSRTWQDTIRRLHNGQCLSPVTVRMRLSHPISGLLTLIGRASVPLVRCWRLRRARPSCRPSLLLYKAAVSALLCVSLASSDPGWCRHHLCHQSPVRTLCCLEQKVHRFASLFDPDVQFHSVCILALVTLSCITLEAASFRFIF